MSSWFRPKRYGYGAAPSNWKGWLATALFVALIAVITWLLEPGVALNRQGVLILDGTLIGAIVLFVWISWKKTDGAWRWRWGSNGQDK
jgi:hypothetical protein